MKIIGIIMYDVVDFRGKWFSTIDEHQAQTIAHAMDGKIVERVIPK